MCRSRERQMLEERLTNLSAEDFDSLALDVFLYQAEQNPVYGEFLALMNCIPNEISSIDEIPFLPISAFKHNAIQSGQWIPEAIFRSSGTTAALRSKHMIHSLSTYHHYAIRGFEDFFHELRHCVILGLLPHYLQASDSSLVSMVRAFMRQSGSDLNGFYLDDFAGLARTIAGCNDRNIPYFLFGVSYALLDFAIDWSCEIGDQGAVIETGGMKGRKQELSKEELHAELSRTLHTDRIFSEYGMTELLSQAYAAPDRKFFPNSTMKVKIKEIHDPFAISQVGKTGIIHVIDLLNIDTCSFIATEDLGRSHSDKSFEVLGRLDHSDLRGCQLLYI